MFDSTIYTDFLFTFKINAQRNSFIRPISDLFSRNSTQTDSVRLPVERDALEYKMTHEKRGLAYIFNHENFDDDLSLKPRIGTDADCQNLKRTLEHLSFQVVVCKDLSYDEIIEEIEKSKPFSAFNSMLVFKCGSIYSV